MTTDPGALATAKTFARQGAHVPAEAMANISAAESLERIAQALEGLLEHFNPSNLAPGIDAPRKVA